MSRTLLVRLEEAAAALGYRRIQLETGEAQPEAMALYESTAGTGSRRMATTSTPRSRSASPRSSIRGDVRAPRGARGRHRRGQVVIGPRPCPSRSDLGAPLGGLDAGLPGHGHRHGEADHRRASRGAASPPRSPRPVEDGTVAWFQKEAQAAIADVEARGRRALLVGGTALYVQAIVDDLDIPGQFPEVRAELEAELDTEALHERLCALDPPAAERMEPSNRRRGRPRRWRSPSAAVVPSPASGPDSTRTRRRPSPWWGCGVTRPTCGAGSRCGTRSSSRRGSSTRCAGCTPIHEGSPHRPAGPRVQGAPRPPHRDHAPRRSRRPVRAAHRPLRAPPGRVVSAVIPGSSGSKPRRTSTGTSSWTIWRGP